LPSAPTGQGAPASRYNAQVLIVQWNILFL
jgi:hypothetical protein